MITWYLTALVLSLISLFTNSFAALAAGMIVALTATIVEKK